MKNLTPRQAWALLQADGSALLVDVRMEIEYLYVGHPPGVVHVPWYEYPEMQPHAADFAARVAREAGGQLSRPVLLLCRSGQRTLPAGAALEQAGFTQVINVLHGFEGELDENFQRGRISGWRHDGLPWEQM